MLGEVAGADVLCLVAGGGQQSAAFALLGARVSVLDFSSVQLERDHRRCEHRVILDQRPRARRDQVGSVSVEPRRLVRSR